jgi:hypothetical protein
MTNTSTEYTNNFAVMEMRFAFERDMVRRGTLPGKAWIHGTMEECEVCGEPFEKTHWQMVTCSNECKLAKQRQVRLAWYHRNKPTEEEKELDTSNATGDPWLNLVLAIAEGDEEREEWLEIYKVMRKGVEMRTGTMI